MTLLQELEQGERAPFDAPLVAPFVAHLREALVPFALEQVTQGGSVRGGLVVEGLDQHRVPQHAGGQQLFARDEGADRLTRLVDLHAPGVEQAHDPDPAGPGGEQVGDLFLQLGLVLPHAGVLDGERGHAGNPARPVGDVADGDVGGAEIARARRVAGIDASLGHLRIGAEQPGARDGRARAVAARGSAVDGVPVAELVAITGAKVARPERARAVVLGERSGVLDHDPKLAPRAEERPAA